MFGATWSEMMESETRQKGRPLPEFSQFLQLQQEQQQLQQHYSRTFLPVVQSNSLGMLSHRSGTSCSEASTGSPTPSPSPPLSITSENYPTGKNPPSAAKAGKSFTIDAILGIRDREVDHVNRDQMGMLPNNYHPRLGLHLSGSKLEIPGNYGNGLDVSSSRLEPCGRKMDMSRLSRDVLAFQLPTDLSSSSASNTASVSNRRDLHQSSFQSSRLSEKSTPESGKKCSGKSKRVRTIFTPEQLERLEAEFERQQYMVGPERLYLAHTLQLTEAQVKVWFQNRRIKWRKQHLEIQQQRLAAIKQQQQRSEGDDSDDDSVDSNNYSFSTDTNDNAANGYYKSIDNTSGLESDNIMHFQVTNEEDSSSLYHKNENPSESIKSSSPSEVI